MTIALQEAPANMKEQGVVVNDFSINIATINGSGSQTSNGVLLRTLFKMGIPVNGKNLFPSNIQGLPTWYIIRLSKDGYLGRKEAYEIAVCLNGRTVAEDMANVAPGGIVLYDDSLPIAARRHDVTYYPMPVGQLIKEANLPHELRDYIANMVYVGVLAHLLEIDLVEIEAAISWNFGGKPKPTELNMNMVRRAYDWAKQNLVKTDPYRVARDDRLQRGQGADRRQHGGGARLRLRRRHRRGLVSDHAGLQPGGCAHQVPAADCAPIRRPARRTSPSSRPRMSWRRWAWWSAPAGPARVP